MMYILVHILIWWAVLGLVVWQFTPRAKSEDFSTPSKLLVMFLCGPCLWVVFLVALIFYYAGVIEDEDEEEN